jgi:hypothetical protein
MKKAFAHKKTINNATNTSKNWLQRLKDESWEAELLVSTVSIFGTFQLFDLINWWCNKLIDILNPSQYLIGYFIVYLGLLAISILASMFIIHFFLRAYWVGLVGLNSVFPDYSIENSAYSKIYTEKILSILPKLKDSIQKVDELCSIIFSVAFSFLLIYMYMAIFVSLYLLIYNLLTPYINSYILLIPAMLILFIVLLQAIVSIIANLKSNKSKKKLQILSFKLVKLVSKLIYGPAYKSILQISMIFGSNFKKKKSMVYLIVLFFISGAILSGYKMTKTNIPYLTTQDFYFDKSTTYSIYYKSENKYNTFLLSPEIDSDIITNKSIKIFIPIFSHEKKLRQNVCDTDGINRFKDSKHEVRAKLLDCYHQYNSIYINGKKEKVEFKRYKHSRTKQFGIISYFKVSNLKEGLNTLTVKKEYNTKYNTEWEIPFYYFDE